MLDTAQNESVAGPNLVFCILTLKWRPGNKLINCASDQRSVLSTVRSGN
jgi:hypothetical protein